MTKDALLALVKAESWDKIPAGNFMRLGVNVGGTNEAITQAEEDARYEAALTPEQRAKREAVALSQAAAAKAEKALAAKAREWDRGMNEGGEGYNPYRNQPSAIDRTPYHKGDDIAE
jgi:hypothetical protein